MREVRIEEETFLEDKALDGNFVIHLQECTTPVHLPGRWLIPLPPPCPFQPLRRA